MNPSLVLQLESSQLPSGCFPSHVTRVNGKSLDYNGFTAAIVLRTLRRQSRLPLLRSLTTRALDYLESCRSPHIASAFAFWPEGARPPWAASVPADLDDTTLMTTELLRAERIEPRQAIAVACRVLLAHRVCSTDSLPSWIQSGAFLTWIAPRRAINVVDCCVNANVLGLLALLDARHLPGYEAAISTIRDGLTWAGSSMVRLRTLSPFYPSPHDLCEALAHAVECGVRELRDCHAELQSCVGARDPSTDAGCCSSAYGDVVWYCRGIPIARALVSGL